MKTRHPTQPLVMVRRVIRFKENQIVRHLLDNGGIDMNQIALMDFAREDEQQFAQLIGYSLSGYDDLSYVTAAAWKRAYEEGGAIRFEKKKGK